MRELENIANSFKGIQKSYAISAGREVRVIVTPEAIDWLAQLGYDPQFGARPVKRVIQKRILNELSKQLLGGKISKNSEIIVDSFNNELVFRNKS